jgi:MFS family permease
MLSKVSFLKKYYAYTFLSSADFTRGIHLVYILDLGYQNFHTGLLQSILFTLSFLLELPSGYFADKSKKKYSLLFSAICFSVSAFIYLISSSLASLFFIYALQGCAFAFQSGASQSLLYEKIASNKIYNREFNYYLSRASSLSGLSLVLSIIVGGYLQKIGWSYVFFALLIVHLSSILVLLSIHEPNPSKHSYSEGEKESSSLLSIIKDGKVPIYFFIGIGLIEAVHTPFFVLYQNYLHQYHLSAEIVAMVMAAAMTVSAVAALFAPRLAKISISTKVFLSIALLFALVGAHFFKVNIILSMFMFLLINSVPNLLFVFTDEYILESAPDDLKATVMSFASLVKSALIFLSYLVLGYSYDFLEPSVAASLIAFLLIPASIFLFIHFRGCVSLSRKKN